MDLKRGLTQYQEYKTIAYILLEPFTLKMSSNY